MKKAFLILLVAFCLFRPNTASADGRLCNQTSALISATWGEEWPSAQGYYSKAYAVGWYNISPGSCATPIVGDVCFWWAYLWDNCSTSIITFAFNGSGTWGGVAPGWPWEDTICTPFSAFDQNPPQSLNYGVTQTCTGGSVWQQWAGMDTPVNDNVTINFTQ